MMKNKLRIAMLSTHSCPVGNLGAKDTGGMSVYIRELAGEMGRQGHFVDIYTRVHDPADPQIIYLGENVRLIHMKAGQEDIHKLALYCYLPEFTCNLENFRRDNGLNYDVVFSHYWLSGWVGQYLRRWWQVPHVAMFHTLGAIKNSMGIGEEEPELRIVTERNIIVDCDCIIAATAGEKEELIRYYNARPEKVGIVPCGVNMDIFQPVNKTAARSKLGLSDDDRIILFVGRIDPLKGLEQLFRAVPLIGSTSGLKLIVIGGDEDSRHEIEKLRKLSRELDIQKSVTFRGIVRHEELPYFYSAADVCAVPSYHESFGLVALESLSCGTPVVATDVGDLKHIIRQKKNGYVLKNNTPRSLAGKIDTLLQQKDHYTASVYSIRESVSKYGWRSITRKIIKELRLVLADRLIPVT